MVGRGNDEEGKRRRLSKERGVRQGGKGLRAWGRKGHGGEGKMGRKTKRAIVSLRLRAGRKTRKTCSVIVDSGGCRQRKRKGETERE